MNAEELTEDALELEPDQKRGEGSVVPVALDEYVLPVQLWRWTEDQRKSGEGGGMLKSLVDSIGPIWRT
jgi:hypothetical protein